MKSKFIAIMMVLFIALSLVVIGCSKPSTPAPDTTPKPSPAPAPATQEKTWDLKFSTEQNPNSILYTNVWEPWAKSIEEATNGRVTLTIYPSQTLMKTTDAWEGVKSGIGDIAWTGTGLYPGQFTYLDSVTLPFIVPNAEVASKVAWEIYEKFPEIQTRLDDMKILCISSTDPYMFVSSKKNYKTMADFKNQTLRMNSGQPTEMMKLLGGASTFFAFGDMYMNLEKGVVDGAAAPAEAIMGFKLYEPAPYLTYVPLTTSTLLTFMNKDVWNEMPKDIQDALMSVSGEALAINMGRDAFDFAAGKLHETVSTEPKVSEYTVPKEEWSKWAEIAGKPLWDKWAQDQKANGVSSAQQILDETIKLSNQFGAN